MTKEDAIAIENLKAEYEAKLAELMKEIDSLKEACLEASRLSNASSNAFNEFTAKIRKRNVKISKIFR